MLPTQALFLLCDKDDEGGGAPCHPRGDMGLRPYSYQYQRMVRVLSVALTTH